MRIVHELGLDDSVDTLGRWMSHRIAELMERVDQANSEPEREAAKRECTEVILRVWDKRRHWPQGQPLADLSAFLNTLSSEPHPMQYTKSEPSTLSWVEVLPLIRNLAEHEDQIVLDAAIADLDLDQDRRWLEEHPDELSEEERRTITWLITQQERMGSQYYKLDDKDAPGFASLTCKERTQLVFEALDKISQKRQKILTAIRQKLLGHSSKEVAGGLETESIPEKTPLDSPLKALP
jgi:hypothetical protein